MTAKPKCIILDDEELALDALRTKIEEINLLEIERAYLSADELLDDINDLEATIFFLDIEMEESNSGTEIAKKLKNKLVIFVSGYDRHIVDVVNVNPIAFVNYLSKGLSLLCSFYDYLSTGLKILCIQVRINIWFVSFSGL